jgi:signal transduction histidine kinase
MAVILKTDDQMLSNNVPGRNNCRSGNDPVLRIMREFNDTGDKRQKRKGGAKLVETDFELGFMTNRLLEVQEAERRKIASELHDDTGQHLTVLKLLLSKIAHSLGEDAPSELGEAQDIVSDVINQIRTLSFNLRPGMLDDLGLLPALQWYFQDFSHKTDIQINFKHSGLEKELPVQIRVAAYRIVQEALTNFLRYAKTGRVAVFVEVVNETLNIQIKDKGIGFEPAKVSLNSSGLRGIRERTRYLGGRFILDSAPGKGTCLAVSLPLESKAETLFKM